MRQIAKIQQGKAAVAKDDVNPVGVLIAYAEQDLEAARDLKRRMAAAGCRVWLPDDELSPGKNILFTLEEAMAQAAVAVVCLSRAALRQSGRHYKLIRWALDRQESMPPGDVFTIPAKLEPCDTPSLFGDIVAAELFRGDGEFAKLRKAFEGLSEARKAAIGLNASTNWTQSTQEKAQNAIQIWTNRDTESSSPFQFIGPLEVGARSYIKRSCDNDLCRAVRTHTFIWLQGDFQYGKTSLLNRHSIWLGKEWKAVYVDIQGCQRSNDKKFREHFFEEIGDNFETKINWRSLKELLRKYKIAFILDEFGSGKSTQTLEMLEHFQSLARAVPDHLRLIVSCRNGPNWLLNKEIFEDPKHRSVWELIHLHAFNQQEVAKLIDLFPERISSLLHERTDQIMRLTSYKPQSVQKKFFELWDELKSQALSPAQLSVLIDSWLSSEEPK